MRKSVYICDHCGQEFDSDGYTEIDLGDFPFIEEADLCSECYDEIIDIVGKFMPRIKRK